MTADNIAFVDSISATAGVRLNLSSTTYAVLQAGTSLPPPPLRRVLVNTLLTDGSQIPNTAYDNRTITLHIQIRNASAAAASTALQNLHRELDRANNILRWQPDPNIPAVYFRTFRAPDYDPDFDHGIGRYDITVAIPAEPFAFGLPVTSGTITIQSDPAAGSNGKFFDITGVTGDVEAPLLITLGGGIANHQSVFAMRRRGTPSAAAFFVQAEALTQNTDTTTQANNANYSGSSNNFSATTFSGSNSLSVARLSTTLFPAAASVDVRGIYRVFARVNASSAGASFTAQLLHGQKPVSNLANNFTVASTSFPHMVDLGLVQMPEGFDPVSTGPSGAALSVAGIKLQLMAQRTGGSGSLLWDYLLFMPADELFCLVNWGASSVTSFVLDGYSRSVYGLNASGQVADVANAFFTGDIPAVIPGQTNRVCYINDASPTPSVSDAVSGNATLTYQYWPRYLYVRPVLT
jgi:hypothetical protein